MKSERVYAFVASSGQRGLWFVDQISPGSPFYNMHLGTRIAAAVDVPALERALNEMVRRHESLRTAFREVDGEPTQLVRPELRIPLPVTDLTALPAAEREAEVARIADAQAQRPFTLSQWPLLRAALVRLGPREHVLLLTMHHIVCDYWSLQLFQEELSDLYQAYAAGHRSPLPEVALQYADYAEWERDWLAGPGRDHLDYWKKQLAGVPTLRLPEDRPRPQVPTFAGAANDFELSAELHAAVVALARAEQATSFMVMLAAFQVLLHRYTGQDDIAVGTPVANRNRPEVQNVLGLFVNSLVLRTDLSGEPTFREALARVRRVVLDAFAHQEVPFEVVVSELRPERAPGHNPLFRVHFQLLSDDGPADDGRVLLGEPLGSDVDTAKFDLALDLWEFTGGCAGHLEYSTELFDEATMARFARHFRRLLAEVTADPDRPLSRLRILSGAERRQLVRDWNDTGAELPPYPSWIGLFDDAVERTPDAVALRSGPDRLTYRQLRDRVGRLVARLRAAGAGPETIVAVCAERSADLVVGVLGVLGSGAALLPLQPRDPVARLRLILDDARPGVLLTQRDLAAAVPAGAPRVLFLEETPDEPAPGDLGRPDPDTVAYVIYTSGSTGRPKGVQISHRALANQMLWMQSVVPLDAGDRVLQKYPVNFDAALCEMAHPLMAGACLIVAEPADHFDVTLFARTLDEQRITVLDLVPSMLAALLDEPRFPAASLRRVICGGEVLTPELRQRFVERCDAELHNIYGPTEATIGATSWRCDTDDAGPVVPIGRPAANLRAFVLDPALNLVPAGVRGELYLAGDGLARGYLGQPALTADRFLPDPFADPPGGRLYRTGDSARHLPGGVLDYLGRADNQVKIRGYRVELDEIEAAVARHEQVRACTVVAAEDEHGRRRVVAHVVPRPDPPELWPSVGEYDVYDDLLYYAMTHDEQRNRAYRRAVERAVRGKVVLDLGTGADAVLARLCAAAGAERVYAVEVGEDAYGRAWNVIRELGLDQVIQVIHGDSSTVELPEPVDVCVSEILGTIGSSEGVVPILNDARRFLTGDGVLIPRRCVTRIAPVTLPEPLAAAPAFPPLPAMYAQRVFDTWGGRFDLRLCVKNFPAGNLLAAPGTFEDLDFTGPVPIEDESRIRVRIDRAGRWDGFLLWLNLLPSDDDPLDSLHDRLSWLPVYLPVFHPGVDVAPGEVIEARCVRTANGARTPDYTVRGALVRAGGERLPFTCVSAHHGGPAGQHPYYARLFAADPAADAGADDRRGLAARLRTFLREQLPEYLIPGSFALLDELPRTPSGKVDRSALAARRAPTGVFRPPATEMEELVTAAWREVLGVDRVGARDNFFDLGGDSLLITKVRGRLQARLGREVTVLELFRYPTVDTLARHLSGGDTRPAGTPSVQDLARRQREALRNLRARVS
ncbi:non-ribosomal peptide synthetase [Actinoplanes sp. L3-i22]|uniref:non-ribosomal peptide synthetase n=1 Tax=Actinoplanes sp. L3-i22 TaxID=2836373 RepID=UPI001C751177|nr:non-ribosomal peptide synthetase [Actinoplanes sp. L3-i22]BCY09675.1 hypothetical protein L3i22_047630 [Actinoplanes sp. L3-i22]